MDKFSDYIVYVDESGDHNLNASNAEYPVFVLAFCVFSIKEYVTRIVPAIEEFKFKYFGHDMAILHEREIRKAERPFEFLRNPETRNCFMSDLNNLINEAKFTIVASAIDKTRFTHSRNKDSNPYHVALEYGLERVFMCLQEKKQHRLVTHIVFEGRGSKEDKDLELEFRRILDCTSFQGMAEALNFKCVPKLINSSGLQLADMVARPIGNHILNPDQKNRAWEIIKPKIRTSREGMIEGYGLKIYPQKR